MKNILDDLFYAFVESKPCPYLHDPVYKKYCTQVRTLEDRLASTLGEPFLEELAAAESDLMYFQMKQSFFTGLRLGIRLGLL